MTVADRISVMAQGRIVQVGPPAEIYEAPKTRYVADFIGSVNIFEGAVEAIRPGALRLAAADGFTLDIASEAKASPGQTLWFAVRPEKVRISPDPLAGAAPNSVSGQVWDIAYLGDMSLYNVRLDSGKLVRASLLNASRTVERPISWEDRVWLSFAPDAGVVLTS